MSPDEAAQRAKTLVDVDIKERRRDLQRQIGALKNKFSAAGRLKSGAYAHAAKDIFEAELKTSADVIAKTITRVFASVPPTIHEDRNGHLRALFSECFDECFVDMGAHLKADIAFVGDVADRITLDDARQSILRRAEAEPIFGALEFTALDRLSNGSSANQFNFYGNVAAVQSGTGAVANITQSLGEVEREALISAIELARDAIERASELGEVSRMDAIESAMDVVAQLRRERPNESKLRAALDIVASTVQGLASGDAAYKAIVAAATVLG